MYSSWVLKNVQSYITTTIRVSSHKFSLCLFSVSLLSPNLVITDLFPNIIVLSFLECHIHDIIQYTAFCVWLLSCNIMLWDSFMLLHVNSIFFFSCWVVFHCVRVQCLFIKWCTFVSSFGLLWIMLWILMYRFCVVITISFLLIKYLEMELLCCMANVYLNLKIIAKLC